MQDLYRNRVLSLQNNLGKPDYVHGEVFDCAELHEGFNMAHATMLMGVTFNLEFLRFHRQPRLFLHQ